MKAHILLVLLLSYPGSAVAEVVAVQTEDVRISFSSADGQWLALALPDLESDNRYDLEADRRDDGSVLAVRIDLDGDGALEWFIRTLCGNGGCEYPIFDGKSGRYMGSVFGSQIWLLKRQSHGLPTIETFSHVAALIGMLTRYEFDGSKYSSITSKEIRGEEETEAVYQALQRTPKW